MVVPYIMIGICQYRSFCLGYVSTVHHAWDMSVPLIMLGIWRGLAALMRRGRHAAIFVRVDKSYAVQCCGDAFPLQMGGESSPPARPFSVSRGRTRGCTITWKDTRLHHRGLQCDCGVWRSLAPPPPHRPVSFVGLQGVPFPYVAAGLTSYGAAEFVGLQEFVGLVGLQVCSPIRGKPCM